MDKLQTAREKINVIDEKMAKLFCERMEAVRLVADYKQQHGLPVFDEARETEVVKRNSLLVEDEELRAQIKGSGIGTSATRAEILKKLVNNKYIALNKKTQILTPTLLGEMIFDVVNASISPLLRADLTASWEKGLTYVAEGSITSEEYMQKLEGFVSRMTNGVKGLNNQNSIVGLFMESAKNYK